MSQLALPLFRRYRSPVTVNPVAGRENPIIVRRTSAKPRHGAFLLPVFYGGCARARFGVAGCLTSRFLTPRTVATQSREKDGGDSSTLGAPPMNHPHALNPSTSHAAAWKARALAALHSNSSLSVRLARYNAAMARARSLEAQEVRP